MRVVLLAALLLRVAVLPSYGLEPEDEPGPARPGLLARYTSTVDGRSFTRIDRKLSFDWRDGLPDERLAKGAYRVEWKGSVFVAEDGLYRFSLEALGNGEARIDGGRLAAVALGEEAETEGLSLEYGYHGLVVNYEAPPEGAALCLRWGKDGAPLDVVPARSLFHDPEREVAVRRDVHYERGRLLSERLGCEVCHRRDSAEAGESPRETSFGPELSHAAWIRPEYLARFLIEPQKLRPRTPKPALRADPRFPEREARAMVLFLRSVSRPVPAPLSLPPGSVPRGRELFRDVGCAACHSPEDTPERDVTAPPSLVDAVAKWPHHILLQVIRSPFDLYPWGLSPDFRLTQQESVDIGAYLRSLERTAIDTAPSVESEAWWNPQGARATAEIERGRSLVLERGCTACHDLPGLSDERPVVPPAPDLTGKTLHGLAVGCLSPRDARLRVPRYDLSKVDREALSIYFSARPKVEAAVALQERAAREMEKLSCSRCHERDRGGVDAETRLAALLDPVRSPTQQNVAPDLSGVGARLRVDWIRDVLDGAAPLARPWLTLRMPQYTLAIEQVDTIVRGLVSADRGPRTGAVGGEDPGSDDSGPEDRPADATGAGKLREVGTLLLGVRGFNCQNCHFLGKHRPAADTVGPDLILAPQRVDRTWFSRWLNDPQWIRPATPMPALIAAIPGVLGEDLEAQKQALWDFLAAVEGEEIVFEEPPKRVLEPRGRRPLFVAARVHGENGLRAERGLALALPPGPSLLFDAGRLSWVGSWHGAFLERIGTHGAHGRWRPAGGVLWVDGARRPPVYFRPEPGARWRAPPLFRERFGWFERVAYEEDAVRVEYRLRTEGGDWLRVAETLRSREEKETVSIEHTAELLALEGDSSAKVAGGVTGDVLLLAAPGLVGLLDPPLEVANAEGKSIRDLPALTWPGGRLTVEGPPWGTWAIATSTVIHPVLQPFTDDPVDPNARFPAVETEGGGRLAVALPTSEVGAEAKVRFVLERRTKPSETSADRKSDQTADEAAPQSADTPTDLKGAYDASEVTVPEGYTAQRLPLADDFLPCSVAFLDGKLLVGGYDGELRWAVDTDGDGLPDMYRFFGGPLDQANSLLVRGEEVLVASPGAVYSMEDGDGDGVADELRTISSAWDYSGHPFDWFFGFSTDRAGNLYGANSVPDERGTIPGTWRRGVVLRISPDGTTSTYATGTRYEFGWTTERSGRSFFTVNQGPWVTTCAIHELREGEFYGYGEVDISKHAPPVVRVPYPWCLALSGIVVAETGGRFGAFEGQGFAGDYNSRRIIRWTHERVGTVSQGACYEFCGGLAHPPAGLCLGPDGALYVAAMTDGAWSSGPPRGAVYRIAWGGKGAEAKGPFDVEEARVTADGFEVVLTAPVDPASIRDAAKKVHRYFHEYRGGYYSVETVHEDVAVAAVALEEDRRTLRLRLARAHVTPRIYRLQLRGIKSADGRILSSLPFFLTVHAVPED